MDEKKGAIATIISTGTKYVGVAGVVVDGIVVASKVIKFVEENNPEVKKKIDETKQKIIDGTKKTWSTVEGALEKFFG